VLKKEKFVKKGSIWGGGEATVTGEDGVFVGGFFCVVFGFGF